MKKVFLEKEEDGKFLAKVRKAYVGKGGLSHAPNSDPDVKRAREIILKTLR